MKHLLSAVGLAAFALATTPDAAAIEQVGFTSPDGNIGCFMDPWTVRCDIRERSWAPPPRPADCPETGVYAHDYGQGIVLNSDGDGAVLFSCANASVLDSGPAVAYGQNVQVDSIRCQIWPDGVTCSDFLSGKGFWMSRDGYRFI